MWHSYGVIMVYYVVESVPKDQTLWFLCYHLYIIFRRFWV